MDIPRISGIGCFAKPPVLSRVLQRLILAIQAGRPAPGCAFDHERTEAFWSLTAPGRKNSSHSVFRAKRWPTSCCAGSRMPALSTALDRIPELNHAHIIGFFLTLEDCQLNMTIFARGKDDRNKRLRVKLNSLTRLHPVRLH